MMVLAAKAYLPVKFCALDGLTVVASGQSDVFRKRLFMVDSVFFIFW